MRVAIATCEAMPGGFEGDHPIVAGLEGRGIDVDFAVWSDPDVDWTAFDRVVIRSTWDYSLRREEFLGWADQIGERLQNAPALVRWNSDKRYLVELGDAGVPIISTKLVGPGDPTPELDGEVVVKPTVSAGARDTGRFSPSSHEAARALCDRITADGRAAMVQPYLSAVDEHGETAIVFIAGRESHVLHKRAVLRPDEEAPLAAGPITAAAVMFDDTLVGPGSADDAHRELAALVMDWVADRFGASPLYARVDMLPAEDGEPVLGELEAVEPNLYLGVDSAAPGRLVEAILA